MQARRVAQSSVDPDELRRRIDGIVSDPMVPGLLSLYFDGGLKSPFAGMLFDQFGSNNKCQIEIDDLLAVSLLDVRFGPRAVRALLHDSDRAGRISDLLSKLTMNLWETTEADRTVMKSLFSEVTNGVHGVSRTIGSKILARKRPGLFPIRDRVIDNYFGLGKAGWWESLAKVLSLPGIKESLRELAPSENITELRILDVSVWMLKSGSRDAMNARDKVALGLKGG